MKKLLLILALLAYVAVSCDKPETKNVDEPTENNTGNEDKPHTDADTCRLTIHVDDLSTEPPVVMIYNTPSEEINFEASVNSIFKHFTITLRDGSLDTAIYHNVSLHKLYSFPSNRGEIDGMYYHRHFDSVKRGKYLIVMWQGSKGGKEWGTSHFNAEQTFLWREITFNTKITAEGIIIDDSLRKYLREAEPLKFTKF